MELELRRGHLEELKSHARESYPQECCGLLLGRLEGKVARVEEVAKAKNLLGSSVAFKADPELVFKVLDQAEARGLELVGIYHSHPNLSAFVSSSDREVMKLWPGVVWLILGTRGKEVKELKAYVFQGGAILEAKVRVLG